MNSVFNQLFLNQLFYFLTTGTENVRFWLVWNLFKKFSDILNLITAPSDSHHYRRSEIQPSMELHLGDANYELIFVFYWTGSHFFGQGRWSDHRWFKYDNNLDKGRVDWSDKFDRKWRNKYLYGLMYMRVESESHQVGTPVNLSSVKSEYYKVGTGYRTSLTDNYRQKDKKRFKASHKATATMVD